MPDKIKIKLCDLSFPEQKISSKYGDSKFIEWDRTGGYGPIAVFTDSCLSMVNLPCYKNSYKLAWNLEPIVIRQDNYRYSYENQDKFDLILSHNLEFLSQLKNGVYLPNLMTWIPEKYMSKYHVKAIDISIIASAKNYAPGHQLRHSVINAFKDKISVFGYGYKPIEEKIEVLRPSRFHISIENCKIDSYLSEKFLDSLVTKTVPIHWGSTKAIENFDQRGIFTFENLKQLNKIINDIKVNPQQMYESMYPYVLENYNRILELGLNQEDYIFDILKKKGLVNNE